MRQALEFLESPELTHKPQGRAWRTLDDGVDIDAAAWNSEAACLFETGVVKLIARLHRNLEPERQRLLDQRTRRKVAYDAGGRPEFLVGDEGAEARTTNWRVAPLPEDLLCRRVEITGPVSDAKMVINMLSRSADGRRADAAMLDFEDAMKPSWENVMRGMTHLIGAVEGTLSFSQPASNGKAAKVYRLDRDDRPLLMVRVRGLHLAESNLHVDGTPVSAGLMDLVLCAYHTAARLVDQGRTPKYYIPKCEHHLEARWWNRLFTMVEEALGLAHGTIRVTFLIETLPAAFQMEEILFEIRERAAGLNGGRWDKIFSDIKVLMHHADGVLADRGSISLNRPWMKNYVLQLIRVCHRHGAFAMGGMAAFTPGRTAARRAEQLQKVVDDKQFEAGIGHDGCWVSHPFFIGPAMDAFKSTNQLNIIPELPEHPDIMPVGTAPHTLAGLRKNLRVGIAYVKGWHDDIGCVAWDDLMEDLATLEISRAQVWQWILHAVQLDDGQRVSDRLVRRILEEELGAADSEIRASLNGISRDGVEKIIGQYRNAAEDVAAIFTEQHFRDFLMTSSDPAGLSTSAKRDRLRAGR